MGGERREGRRGGGIKGRLILNTIIQVQAPMEIVMIAGLGSKSRAEEKFRLTAC